MAVVCRVAISCSPKILRTMSRPLNVAVVAEHPRYAFEHVDIRSASELARVFARYRS